MVFVVDVVSDPSVSSSAPVIDPSSSFVSGRSKMSFTEKPVFVLVNDIFWWGGNMQGKVAAAPFWTIRCSEKTNKQGKKRGEEKNKQRRCFRRNRME